MDSGCRLEMENWGCHILKHLSCPLREPDVFNIGIPVHVLEQILQDFPGFHFELKANLETGLMIRWLVRCPWYLSVFDSAAVDCSCGLLFEFLSHFGANWMLWGFYKPEISFNATSILMKIWRPGWKKPLICFRVGEDRIRIPCCTTSLALIAAPTFVIPTSFSLDR